MASRVGTNNKLPSWKRGKSFAIGRLKFVELPLVMSHRILYLPKKPGETEADRLKVAENSLHKLLIIQRADGSLVTRIVTIIPSLNYLTKAQFNLSAFSLEHIPADFEGIINVADWNESQVTNWLYNEGRRKEAKISKGQLLEGGRRKLQREIPCPQEYDIIDYHKYCIDVWGSDDEPSNFCDDPENWKIGQPIYGYYIPEGPCYEEDNTGDPCVNMTTEECNCMMLGIGCSGDGRNGDGEYLVYDGILLDLNNPCVDNVYRKMNMSLGGLKASLINWVNQTFGQSSILDLRIKDGEKFSDPKKYADWGPHPTEPGQYFLRLDDLKFENASQEFRSLVILHELYHGYLTINGLDVLSSNDHNLFVAYRNRLADQLQIIFPDLTRDDALNLTWAGLASTAAWGSSLSQADRDSIGNKINAFVTGNKGNYSCN